MCHKHINRIRLQLGVGVGVGDSEGCSDEGYIKLKITTCIPRALTFPRPVHSLCAMQSSVPTTPTLVAGWLASYFGDAPTLLKQTSAMRLKQTINFQRRDRRKCTAEASSGVSVRQETFIVPDPTGWSRADRSIARAAKPPCLIRQDGFSSDIPRVFPRTILPQLLAKA